ncbi:MAG: histidine kinase, partial [Pseudomonadota bacterium]|nr:histidine kinase [Pseudomonadota bacterium]
MVAEAVPERSLVGWLHDLTQGLVMLLIIYLVAAKIVVRQTARSDARAAQAEASAAAAAADAEHETLERQLAEARLQTLQAQVEPHFLFNTLASVAFLIETDPARASAMQKNLIAYLRAALPQMRTQHSHLGREGELSRAYLEILKMRMEDRLQVAIDIPEGLRSAEFPPMMLQTLVENAIQHGIEPKPAGGEVRVAARVIDGQLEVTVADSGIGLAAAGQAGTAGGGVGLANVRERLERLYPGAASFALAARDPAGAVATLRIPYRMARQADPG